MRLLTIFFCGPTIVTPTFFRSLVCEGEGERRGREREKGRRGRNPDTIRERDVTEGKDGEKKRWKVCVSDGGCDTHVTFNDMLPALLPSLSHVPVIHTIRTRTAFPRRPLGCHISRGGLEGVLVPLSITNKQGGWPMGLH